MSIPCIICHEIFDNDEDVIVLNRCGHVFHGNCLEGWKKSSPQNRASCPLCRKVYDKRSIRKLYFNVEEPEVNAQLSNECKRQKLFSENLVQHNEKLQKELLQKTMEIDKIKESWLQASTELSKIKMEYGIKCQAYSIIDTVNNEYLQDNMKLKDENSKLRSELETLKQNLSKINMMKSKEKSPRNYSSGKFVDLTSPNCESDDDDDIEIIENPQKSDVIEIVDDDSNDVEICKNKQNKLNTLKKPAEGIDSSSSCCDESLKSAKKLSENDDYKRFEDFILSQI